MGLGPLELKYTIAILCKCFFTWERINRRINHMKIMYLNSMPMVNFTSHKTSDMPPNVINYRKANALAGQTPMMP